MTKTIKVLLTQLNNKKNKQSLEVNWPIFKPLCPETPLGSPKAKLLKWTLGKFYMLCYTADILLRASLTGELGLGTGPMMPFRHKTSA